MRITRLLLLTAALVSLPARLLAADPSKDQFVFTGAFAQGTTSITFANNVYTLTFAGDEVISYTLDLNDSKVAGGILRIKEATSDCYPMDGCGPIYRDGNGIYFNPTDYFHKVVLLGSSVDGNTLTLDYQLNYNGTHPFRYEVTIQRKALRIRALDPSGNIAYGDNFQGTTYGNSTGVETPKRVLMQGTLAQAITLFRKAVPNGNLHFFTSNAMDMFQSNASDYTSSYLNTPIYGLDTATTAIDTAKGYKVLSNGLLAAPLDDAYTIVVSSKIRDVLLTTTASPSPYHGILSNRMFFNAPEKVWAWYDDLFDFYISIGMFNLAGYFFDWSAGAIDPPATANAGPDWWPAINPGAFAAMLQKCHAYGSLVGGYTAFNCMPTTAPPGVYNPAEIVKDATGKTKLTNQNKYPVLGVEAAVSHMQDELNQLKSIGANSAYLDIQTYGSLSAAPDGDHLDQQADSPWAKTHRQGFAAQKTWFEGMRTILQGPLMGEGSIGTFKSNMEYLWNGYVDSIQRVINTGSGTNASFLPPGSPVAPTNWPIIPEYEWRVAAPTQVNHGNGFYDRFFGKSDGPGIVDMASGFPLYPLTQDALDLYQAFLITYGHAGYVATNGFQGATEGYITHAAAAQTYFMTNALQWRYFSSPVIAIRYFYGGSWRSFESILFEAESTEPFRHVPIVILFANGLRIYVNHGLTPMNINEGGLVYTLPARSGWWAGDGGLLLSFSAIPPTTNGQRIDYCRAFGQYEYFNGRGVVESYGGLTTEFKLSKWTVFPINRSWAVDEFGNFWPDFGTPPGLTMVNLYPGTATLPVGQRFGLRAIAFFDNNSVLDVTTFLKWFSAQPAVATVNDAGVLEAVGPGTTKIYALTPFGTAVAAPITMTIQ